MIISPSLLSSSVRNGAVPCVHTLSTGMRTAYSDSWMHVPANRTFAHHRTLSLYLQMNLYVAFRPSDVIRREFSFIAL